MWVCVCVSVCKIYIYADSHCISWHRIISHSITLHGCTHFDFHFFRFFLSCHCHFSLDLVYMHIMSWSCVCASIPQPLFHCTDTILLFPTVFNVILNTFLVIRECVTIVMVGLNIWIANSTKKNTQQQPPQKIDRYLSRFQWRFHSIQLRKIFQVCDWNRTEYFVDVLTRSLQKEMMRFIYRWFGRLCN